MIQRNKRKLVSLVVLLMGFLLFITYVIIDYYAHDNSDAWGPEGLTNIREIRIHPEKGELEIRHQSGLIYRNVPFTYYHKVNYGIKMKHEVLILFDDNGSEYEFDPALLTLHKCLHIPPEKRTLENCLTEFRCGCIDKGRVVANTGNPAYTPQLTYKVEPLFY